MGVLLFMPYKCINIRICRICFVRFVGLALGMPCFSLSVFTKQAIFVDFYANKG